MKVGQVIDLEPPLKVSNDTAQAVVRSVEGGSAVADLMYCGIKLASLTVASEEAPVVEEVAQ